MQRELHPLITKQCKCCDRRRRFSTFESTCTHSRSCFCVYIIFSKTFADFRFIPLPSGSCHALSFPLPLAPSGSTSSPSACGFLSNKTFNTCFFFLSRKKGEKQRCKSFQKSYHDIFQSYHSRTAIKRVFAVPSIASAISQSRLSGQQSAATM